MSYRASAISILIFGLIVIFHESHAVLARSMSTDTLETIRSNHVYELGFEAVAKRRSNFYSLAFAAGLTRLSKLEQKIYETMQHLNFPHCFRNSNLNESIKEYMEDYTATSVVLLDKQNETEAEAKAQVVAGNLIGAYRMVRRFRNFIQPWLALQKSSSMSQPELDLIRKIIRPITADGKMKGPYRRDFHLTIFAIIITQFQLEWKCEDIAKGDIQGMELGVTLEAVHCVEIGVHAVASMMYPIGIEWLQLAVLKIQNGDRSVQLGSVFPLLEKAKLKHDTNWKPWDCMKVREAFYERRLNETPEAKELKWQRNMLANSTGSRAETEQERSWDVCSGKLRQFDVLNTKSDLEKSKLLCWYETEVHPTWKIGPLKVELHSRVPLEVVQFYGVLGRNILEAIKAACPPVTPKLQNNVDPKSRHFVMCYTLSETPAHASLRKVAERITGWSMAKAEQIVPHSYPPGGHLRVHTDAATLQHNFKGRIGTLLYHFDGPAIGGETGFPWLKLAVKAIKGSAILWYNRLKSSEIHPDASHSGCPVVQGHKWYAVVWLPYDDQTHLVCDLDKNSKIEYYMNGQSKYRAYEMK